MSDQANFGIAITASDKTAAGAKSAEKRLGLIQKRVGEVSKRTLGDADRSVSRSGGGMLRTFALVEKAAAKAFGGRAVTEGLVKRMGAVREATAAAGEGMGEAAASGGALEGAMGALGVVAGATVGILAAAGYAAFKLADGWAKGAASIGRTADTIGIATKALQEFQAAGERAGVDKGASTAALGGVAQTLNDARYGRNNEALALMMRLGLKFKQGPDGQLDTAGMTLDLADAISRQKNAQTRRLIAGKFGIGDAALPMFLQGSGQLRSDMADADVHAGVLSDDDVRRGRRIVRKGAIVSQMKDRAMMRAGSFTAQGEEAVYDGIISGGHAIMDGGTSFSRSVHDDFVPASRTMDRAAARIERASYAGGGAGRLSPAAVIARANRGAALRQRLMAAGFAPHDATALAANAVMESGADFRSRQPGGGGRGLWQWDGARKGLFAKIMGVPVEQSSEDQQIRFMRWELANTEKRHWEMAHAAGGDASSVAAGFATYVERPKNAARDSAERAAVAQAMESIPVHVTVDMRGAPAGTKTTVKAGRSSTPAVSHAFAFDPVHGG